MSDLEKARDELVPRLNDIASRAMSLSSNLLQDHRTAAHVKAARALLERSNTPNSISVLEAARIVHDKFKRDMEQGYVTKDKQFAVDLLGKALHPPDVASGGKT